MRILGISGSLREGSYNTRLLRSARAELPEGVELELYRNLDRIPPFSEDRPGGRWVEDLRRAVGEADAVLIATPEYNHSIPGQLKNALDWASRPHRAGAFRGKPVAVLGASTGLFGAVFAQAELRKVLGRMGAKVVDAELPVSQAHLAFRADGSLSDPALAEAVRQVVKRLVGVAVGGPASLAV